MWRMMQADEPRDYVVATGTAHTVRDFLGFAFAHAGLDWERHVRFDRRYVRPAEVDALVGDASLARDILGWAARTLPPELARIMVDADCAALDAAVTTPTGDRPVAPAPVPRLGTPA